MEIGGIMLNSATDLIHLSLKFGSSGNWGNRIGFIDCASHTIIDQTVGVLEISFIAEIENIMKNALVFELYNFKFIQ